MAKNKSLNKLLQAERKRLHLTQAELAARLGVTEDSVQHWEYDGITPQPVNLRSLVEFFGKPAEELGFTEQSQLTLTPPATPPRRFKRRTILIGLGAAASLAVVGSGLTRLAHQNSTITPVYQADFTKEETWQNEWRKSNNENQWKYDAEYKALVSDGSVPFSDFTNLLLVAPYHPTPDFHDYAVEAKIIVTGLNGSHPYTQFNPPFFGFFVRGGALNDKGYAVLLLIYPNHKLGVGAEGQLNILGTNPTQHTESGGYTFDDQPHTYRVEVRGDTIKFLASTKEGSTTEIFSSKDNNYQNGTTIGIEDYGCQLRVYDFKVYPL